MSLETAWRGGAAALLIAGVAALGGCGDSTAKPGAWSNGWYAKHQTPEEVAKYRAKHPTTGAPKNNGDPSNPSGDKPTGDLGPG